MLMVARPAVVQDVPFEETYPVNLVPWRTRRSQAGAAPDPADLRFVDPPALVRYWK
jgi:hypothetical protein